MQMLGDEWRGRDKAEASARKPGGRLFAMGRGASSYRVSSTKARWWRASARVDEVAGRRGGFSLEMRCREFGVSSENAGRSRGRLMYSQRLGNGCGSRSTKVQRIEVACAVFHYSQNRGEGSAAFLLILVGGSAAGRQSCRRERKTLQVEDKYD